MHHSEDIWPVLRHFPIVEGAAADSVQAVVSDGFSGARLWHVTNGKGPYCLRRWPEGTNPVRVKSINSVLGLADLSYVPCPALTNSFETAVAHAGYVWTLQVWMPGQPVTKLPPPRELLRNAMQALALFHRTIASCASNEEHCADSNAVFVGLTLGWPPGLRSRVELVDSYLQHNLSRLRTAPISGRLAELQPRREKLIPLFWDVASRVVDESRQALGWWVPLQPCIRDIHAGHVLFTGDKVTGLIDFDAMRVDSVATDLARLLGSYCGEHFELWDIGLAAYDEIRPLSKDERDLVVHYDRLAVLLTGVQWLDWMLLEGKQFELARVLPRIDATLERLEHLRDNLRIGDGRLVY